jgi:hypothetical protein
MQSFEEVFDGECLKKEINANIFTNIGIIYWILI